MFNRLFCRKSSDSSANSTSSKGVKLNKKNHQPRRMMLEPLESRDLLTVTTGAIDDAEYTQIRAVYPDFNLPELQADLNVMTITPDNGALSLDDLKSAIADAGTTTLPDLILVRTSADANSVTYASNADEISINIDATQYGSITILGWGEEKFTLDANQKSRVMTVSGNKTIANLGGLTILNGNSGNSSSNRSYGGGIYNSSSGTLTITNSTISGNTASSYGGGIYNYSGTLTITNSTISGNTAVSSGGGIYNYAYNGTATLTITNSTISGNTASSGGGGIYNNDYNGTATLTVINSEIFGNTAEYYGGGIYNSGTTTITNSTISGNTASNYGGGIYNNDYNGTATLTVINSEIFGNTAEYYGGGIYNYGTTTITNSTISGNTASGGGGIYNYYSGTTNITNSTISGNTASFGGGIDNYSGTLTITNSTISGNTASSKGGGIYNSSDYNGTVTLTITNSIVSGNYNGNVYGNLSSNSSNNLIDYYPGFIIPPQFDSEGKLTNADTMDLHLRSDSIAIDKGDNTAVENLETDIEGNVRIYGESVDIGAYEYQGDRNDEPIPYSTVVNTLNDSFDLNDDEWSLREAIYYASEYVTITFADELEGTIVLTMVQLDIEAPLAIDGNNRIVIDGNQKSRIFNVSAGTEESPVVLNGLTIQNGKASYGGGIYNYEGTLTITNSTISGNTANSEGGGIYNYGSISTLTITNSTISGNTANSGGGVYNSGALTITNSTISENTANDGGGIYNYSGTLTITNSTISGNTAKSSGGGIYNNRGTLTVTNSTISGNTASYGGGIDNSGSKSTLTITNSTISGNTASYGGGIYNSGTTTITNSTISGNTASVGGGIYNYSGTTNITNSTISGNTAEYSGGGIYNNDYATLTVINSEIFGNTASSGGGINNYGTTTITNSTISGNTASSGGGIDNSGSKSTLTITNSTISGNTASRCGGGIDNSGITSITNSIVSRNYNGNIYGALSEISSNNLIDYHPGFVCPPQFNSEGKLTNADTVDLHLRSDSIAIDQGNNTAVANLETDVDGNARIYGETVDIGAYEYQGNRNDEPIPYSTVVNTLNDSFDLTDDEWSLREALFYAQEYVTITFADNLSGTIVLALGQLEIEAPLAIIGNNRITIDADQKSRVFFISGGTEESPVVLNGLIIQNGNAYSGGGIYNYGTTTITNSEISGNTASFGGGIYNYYSYGIATLTITNCEISGNTASLGGGINNYGTTTITNSEISGNTASHGGGIDNSGTITITNSTISGNTASRCGGGIDNSGTTTISNSMISGNTASSCGGGIYTYDNYNTATLTITNSTISGNMASSGEGGGIYNYYSYGIATLTITNSTISGNMASSGEGGGIYNYSDYDGTIILTITNSTISGNTASSGGGIYNYSNYYGTVTLTITNSTISGNTASYGGGIYNDTDSYESTLKIINSIVSRNYNGNIYGNLSSNSSNNLIGGYYPGFINPPLFDSEGKLTNADSMDLHLRSDSIAIDKGDNTAVANFETDIEGNVRIYGESVDIGAYEYQGDRDDEPFYSTVVNTLNDSFDLTDDEWSLREAIYYAPEYVTITFDDNLEGTIVLTLGQLEIEAPLVIDGDNRIIIDADQKSRVFYIEGGTTENPVELKGLIIHNGNAQNGGGIYNDGTTTITSSTISGNTASYRGGGIYNSGSNSTLTVTNSTISGNTAEYSGGGIYNSYGTLTITNSTISGNTATSSGSSYSSGGGIYNSGFNSTLTVTNSIVSRNYNGNVSGNLSSNSSNNLIGGYYPGFINPPLFDSEGKLTNADSMDLHLRSDSIAIDKGDNTAVANFETDIEGNVRIYGESVDIGAYEYQGDRDDEPFYSTVVNTLNDSFDLNDDEWSLREAIYYASEYVTITFADELKGTIVLTLGQLEIEAPLAIDGDNRIAIDADQKSRVFCISVGTEESPVVLNGLSIQNGKATDGGGIYNSGTTTITNSTISGNTAASGGGIYNDGTTTITISTISGNTASDYGGGIYNDGTTTITNSTISGNTAKGSGGGIYNDGITTITNSTISGNTASSSGGGIHNDGTTTITNSTISGNTAASGGGIDNYYGTNIYNTIVAVNTANNGVDVYKSSGTINAYNSLSSYTAWGGSDNIEYDPNQPLFVDAENGDYHILPGSQAYNTGNNTYAYAAGLTYDSLDLAGLPRISDEDIDIGAYECFIPSNPIEPKKIVSGNLTAQNNYQVFYSFALDSAATISLSLLQGDWENLDIKLFGKGFSDFLTSESGEITLAEGGTYYLRFSSKNPEESQSFTFRVNLHDAAELPIGTDYQGVIPASRYARIFKVETTETKILEFLLDAETTNARNEIYVKYNSAPTRSDYDWSSVTGAPDQSLIIDNAAPGTYYVLIYSDYCPTRSAYTLRANLTSIKLEDYVMTGVGVGEDSLEFSISGGGFDNTVRVFAVNTQTGTAVEAQSARLSANGQIAATFNKNLPAGDYTLRLVKDEDVAESLKTFTYSGTYVSGLKVDFTTKLILPGTLYATYYRESCNTFYVEYTNNSEFAIAAPLLHLVCKNNRGEERGLMTLDASLVGVSIPKNQTTVPEGFSTDLYMIASGETVGVLQPGETARIPVYWRGWLGDMEHVDFSLEVIAQDHTSEVNWEHELFGVLDEYERTENAVYLERLQSNLGNTWGEYVVKLSQAATEIYRDYGVEVKNAEELKAYLIDKAHAESMETIVSELQLETPIITKVDLSRNDKGQLKIYVRWDNIISDQIKQYNLEIVDANEDFETGNTLKENIDYGDGLLYWFLRYKKYDPVEFEKVDKINQFGSAQLLKIRVRSEYKDGTYSEWSDVNIYNIQDNSLQALVYIYKNGQWVPAVSTNSETGETTNLTNASKKTYVLIHGLNNSIGSTWLKKMAHEIYKVDSTANILAVDWGDWADGVFDWNAWTPADRIDDVAERLAFQLFGTGKKTYYINPLNGILQNMEYTGLGLNASNMYLIGHSHGAHVAGLTGEFAKSKYHVEVKKITALDPSEDGSHINFLSFFKNFLGTGWGTSSAKFVDVYKSSDLYGGESTWGNDNFLLVEKGKTWSKEGVVSTLATNSITHAFAVDWFITTITTSPNTTSPGFWWNSSSWNAVLDGVNISQQSKDDWNGLIVGDLSGHWRFEALSTAKINNYALNANEGQIWNYPGGNWNESDDVLETLDNTYELQYQYRAPSNLTAGNTEELKIKVTDHSGITSTLNHANNQINLNAVKDFVGILYYEDKNGISTSLSVDITSYNDSDKDLYVTSGNEITRYVKMPNASLLNYVFGQKGREVNSQGEECYKLKLKIYPKAAKGYYELYPANDEGVIDVTIETGRLNCSAEKIPNQRIKKNETADCVLKATAEKESYREKPSSAAAAIPGEGTTQNALESLSNKSYEVINEGIYRYRWVNLNTGYIVKEFISLAPIYEVPDVTVNLGIGTYEFELTVWDRYGFSASDKTSVCILEDPYDDGDHGVSNEGKSVDPNEIIGPTGNDGWIVGEETLAYQINFENDETATAPAQRVDVEMYLDSDLDWSSFQFTGFGWANVFESLGAGSYTVNKVIETEVVPLGENEPVTIYVEVTAGVDLLSGRVYATFQTLQPTTLDGALEEETLLAPMAANIGFLLPTVKEDGEKVDSRGDGFVTYTVKAKKPLITNTEITAVADIQFDFGEIIATNQVDPHDPSQGTDPAKEVPLKIDANAPTAVITSLTSPESGAIGLQWSGSDVGSGIEHYQIYVSADGGAYTLWQSFESDVTSAVFETQTPGEYSFYILAVDGAGNIGGDPEQTTPSILIESDMEMRVVTTSDDHASTDVISDNLETITDWDAFYMEFWTTNLRTSQAGKTSTAKILYDSNVFQLDANQAIAAPAGITAEISDPILESNGMTSVIVTFTVGEDGYTAPGANTYWGAVHFTPNMQDGAGIQNPLESESLDVEMGGAASGTTVKAMPYDLNRDGKVNVDDFILFATVYGTNMDSVSDNDGMYTEKLLSDYDGDGAVNAADFISFATNYGLVKGDGRNVTLPRQNPQGNGAAIPNNSTVSESIAVEQPNTYAQPEPVVTVPIQGTSELVVAAQSASPVYEIAVESELKSAVQVLRQAHSSALLDLYDNQNESVTPDQLSAKAVDESIVIDDDSFDFLFDESDSDSDDSSDVDLSAVLDELELELI